MSDIEVIRELYNRCKDLDIEDTIELELGTWNLELQMRKNETL